MMDPISVGSPPYDLTVSDSGWAVLSALDGAVGITIHITTLRRMLDKAEPILAARERRAREAADEAPWVRAICTP